MLAEPAPCVICGSITTRMAFAIDPSVSTDRRIISAAVENWFCDSCGTVWNQGGARVHAPSFYAEQYDLHGNSAASEWQVHVEGGARGESDAILEFIEGAPLAERGSILEIGCGKGILLGKFLKQRPTWAAFAVEPSLNATEYFKKVLPNIAIHEGPFETAPFRDRKFDFVAVSGVLEHVPQPFEFLSLVANAIALDGRAYIGVPNFVAKPDDLVVFDHLTRFTPDTLDELYHRVGLRVERRDARHDRVWMWDLVVGDHVHDGTPAPVDIAAAHALLQAHMTTVEASLAGFERMLQEARPGEVLALYGLGVLGLWARHQAGDRARAVHFLLDDNPLIWGSRKEGLEIRGSTSIPELGVTRVFIAANPCYHGRMRSNLASVGVAADTVYA